MSFLRRQLFFIKFRKGKKMHYEVEIFISPQNFKIVVLADGKFNWTNFSIKEIVKNFFELDNI